MRNRLANSIIAAALLSGAPLSAQAWGPASLGLQGGFTYIKYPGTRFFDSELHLPGFSLALDIPAPPSLYLIAPITERVALEPSFSLRASANLADWNTNFQVGLRGDYLVTHAFYLAAGAVLARGAGGSVFGSSSGYGLGALGALGIRVHLGGSIDGRAEAVAQFWGRTGGTPAQNAYSLMVGFTSPLSRSGTASRRTPTPSSRGPWDLRVGIAGGFVDDHFEDGLPNDIVEVTLPGSGTQGNAFVSPPAFFVTIPLGGRLALEPGLEVHRTHFNGFTVATGALSTRVNVALGHGWYGGGGLEVVTKKATGTPMVGLAGVSVQGGYGFRLTGAWGGRVELSHTVMAGQRVWHEPPQSVTGLTVAVTVALD
jgi:hypothetical protein